jgi:uncharacterized protein
MLCAMRKALMMVLLAVLPVLAALSAGADVPPKPSRHVTDAAGVLDDVRENALNEQLADYKRSTTNHLVVYVDRNVPAGMTLADMSAEALRVWGIGEPGRNNGAILFLFTDGSQAHLELGYEIQTTITPAVAKRILDGLRPSLEQRDYMTAAEQGVKELRSLLANPLLAYDAHQAATAVDEQDQRQLPVQGRATGKAPLIVFMGLAVVLTVILIARARTRGKPAA